MLTGYDAFCLYNSLKLHFSSDKYDFFKYNGKTNISIESFENRKDKYYFYKLSRRNAREDYIEFLVSNFLFKNDIWVGSLLEEDALIRHRERMKRIQSLTYNLKNDCMFLKDKCDDANELFIPHNGEYPKLLTFTLQNDIMFETFCIMNSLMKFFPAWNSRIKDTIRWPEIKRKCEKYMPFLQFDEAKMKQIIVEELK